MIWILALPPSPPFPSASCLSQSFCLPPVELAEGRGGKGMGEESNETIATKPGTQSVLAEVHYDIADSDTRPLAWLP
jgi:hypothetical protein